MCMPGWRLCLPGRLVSNCLGPYDHQGTSSILVQTIREQDVDALVKLDTASRALQAIEAIAFLIMATPYRHTLGQGNRDGGVLYIDTRTNVYA